VAVLWTYGIVATELAAGIWPLVMVAIPRRPNE